MVDMHALQISAGERERERKRERERDANMTASTCIYQPDIAFDTAKQMVFEEK